MTTFIEKLKIASKLSFYRTIPLDPHGHHMEGEWGWHYLRNPYIFAYAKSLGAPHDIHGNIEKLTRLRERMYLLGEKLVGSFDNEEIIEVMLNDERRYPLPEIKSWPGQEQFLELLRAFEEISSVFKSNADTKEKMMYLDSSMKCSTVAMLPLEKNTDRIQFQKRFLVSLTPGKIVSWTGALSQYVSIYNIIPSEEFLNFFIELVNQYKKHPKIVVIMEKYEKIPPNTPEQVLSENESTAYIFKKSELEIADLVKATPKKNNHKKYLQDIKFDQSLIELEKEIKNLEGLEKRISHSLHEDLKYLKEGFLNLRIDQQNFKENCITSLSQAKNNIPKHHRIQIILDRLLLILTFGIASLFGIHWHPQKKKVSRIIESFEDELIAKPKA